MADPDPMTCDPGSRVYDPDPVTVIPDPIYLVTTLGIAPSPTWSNRLLSQLERSCRSGPSLTPQLTDSLMPQTRHFPLFSAATWCLVVSTFVVVLRLSQNLARTLS